MCSAQRLHTRSSQHTMHEMKATPSSFLFLAIVFDITNTHTNTHSAYMTNSSAKELIMESEINNKSSSYSAINVKIGVKRTVSFLVLRWTWFLVQLLLTVSQGGLAIMRTFIYIPVRQTNKRPYYFLAHCSRVLHGLVVSLFAFLFEQQIFSRISQLCATIFLFNGYAVLTAKIKLALIQEFLPLFVIVCQQTHQMTICARAMLAFIVKSRRKKRSSSNTLNHI